MQHLSETARQVLSGQSRQLDEKEIPQPLQEVVSLIAKVIRDDLSNWYRAVQDMDYKDPEEALDAAQQIMSETISWRQWGRQIEPYLEEIVQVAFGEK